MYRCNGTINSLNQLLHQPFTGHELAHQLFGNLVTMECGHTCGFASWIEYLCVDHCLPDYQIWIQSPTGDFSRALQQDALANR